MEQFQEHSGFKKLKKYEDLEIDDLQDEQKKVDTLMYTILRKIANDEHCESESQREKKMILKAEQILKKSRQIKSESIAEDEQYQSFVNMQQYTETKMVMFPTPISGSSEDEIDPLYQQDDNIVQLLSGDVKNLQWLIIGKITLETNNMPNPYIRQLKQWKGAEEPRIQIERDLSPYVIYKIFFTSNTREFLVASTEGEITLETSKIVYNDKKIDRILFDGFHFNFIFKRYQPLDYFEQIIVYSFYPDIDKRFMIQTIENFRKNKMDQILQFSQGLNKFVFDIVDKRPPTLFNKLAFNLISNWKLENLNSFQKNLITIVLKSFEISSFGPFEQYEEEEEDDYKINFQKMIFSLILYSVENYLLKNTQNFQIFKKLFFFCVKEGNNTFLFQIMEKIIEKKFVLIKNNVKLEEFLRIFADQINQNIAQRLAFNIFSICYYFSEDMMKQKLSKESTIELLLNIQIYEDEIIDSNVEILKKALNHFKVLIQKLTIQNISIKILQKLLRVYLLFLGLKRKNYEIHLQNIQRVIAEQMTKKRISSKISDVKSFQEIISIVQIYIVKRQSFSFMKVDQAPENIFSALLKKVSDLKKREQKLMVLRQINEKILLPIISYSSFVEKDLKQQYSKKLTELQTSDVLIILNEGVTDIFLSKEQNENIYSEIVTSIIEKKFKEYKQIQKGKWHYNFVFSDFINEKLIQRALTLGRTQLDNIQISGFYQKIEQQIKFLQNQQTRQRMLSFLKQNTIEISSNNIKEFLKSDSSFLKILINLKKRGNNNQNNVQSAIRYIQEQIANERLFFDDVIKINPKSQKDKQRFSEIFGDDNLERITKQYNYLYEKESRLNHVQRFLQALKHKIKNDSNNHDTICSEIDKEIQNVSSQKYLLKEIELKGLQKLDFFTRYNNKMLDLSLYECFWVQMPKQIKNLNQLIKILQQKVKILSNQYNIFRKKIKETKIDMLKIKTLNLMNLSRNQISKLISILYEEAEEKHKQKVISIINSLKLVAFFKEVQKALIILFENDKNSKQKNWQNLTSFNNLSQKTDVQEEIDEANFKTKIGQMEQILRNLNLSLSEEQKKNISQIMPFENVYRNIQENKIWQTGSPCILLTLIILTSRKQQFEKLAKIKKSIPSMKQTMLDNQESITYLDYSDFETYYFVLDKVYEKFKSFSSKKDNSLTNFIEQIRLLNKSHEKSQTFLNKKLINIISKTSQFEELEQLLKNPQNFQNVNIKKMTEKSRVTVTTFYETNQFKIKIQVYVDVDSVWKQVSVVQLTKYKDQAFIMKNKALEYTNAKQKQEVIQQMNTFLQITEMVENLNSVLELLYQTNAYILYPQKKNQLKKTENIMIEKGNLRKLIEYLTEMTQLSQIWVQKIDQLKSLLISMNAVKNIRMRTLYQILMKKANKTQYSKFRIIASQDKIEKFTSEFDYQNFKNVTVKEYMENFKKNYDEKYINRKKQTPNPFECLLLIKEFCIMMKNIDEKTEGPVKDREIKKISFIQCSEQQDDYIYSLKQIDSAKLKGIKETQILNCQFDSTKDDIISFFERALIDIDHEYYLFGYQKLSDELQELIIKTIEKDTRPNRMKLFIVGDKPSQRIFRYFRTKQQATQKALNLQKKNDEFFNNFIKLRFNSSNVEENKGKIQIYQSAYAGLGKTHSILNQIKRKNRSPTFFPISGRSTTEQLHKRFVQKLEQNIKSANDNFDIIIQLYEIQNESLNVVNGFLKHVCLFRCSPFNAEIYCINEKSDIYIELQDDKFQALPFLKSIKKEKHLGKSLFVKIDQFQIDKVQPTWKFDKLPYVIYHLNAFDTNQKNQAIQNVDLIKIEDFKETKPSNNYIDLLKKYFLKPFQSKARPTFYLFNYWVDLFFDSCCIFTGCMQLNLSFLSSIYGNNLAQHGLQSIRKDFFQVLLQNSIEFLTFSVEQLEKSTFSSEEKKKSQNLNQGIPFFIVPNADQNDKWFSFIYRNYNEVPLAIRSYLQTQEKLHPKNKSKKPQQIVELIKSQHQLETLQKNDKLKFDEKLIAIIQSISGNNLYGQQKNKDPNYVINIDNFIKICLIAYKMKAKIPLLIQGEAGVGKTALLRHLTEVIFGYEFLPHTINAGVTLEKLKEKVQEAELLHDKIKNNTNKKVCIFFDEFNTLPEIGYIKQIMMEGRLLGEERPQFKNIIVFAACNPYRTVKDVDAQQKNKKQDKLAFIVKRPPLAMGDIMWNFGSLSKDQMDKYIDKMLIAMEDTKIANYKFTTLIKQIQNQMNELAFGSASLRDIERFRQLYEWLVDNLPISNKFQKPKSVQGQYTNRALRAAIVALDLTYFCRFKKHQVWLIQKIISQHNTIPYKRILEFKNFQQDDFCQRLKISYPGVSFNKALKQNLFAVFVCTMKCMPILIVGNPGCSKSLSVKILIDNLKPTNGLSQNRDRWISELPKVNEIFFQGSESCLTKSLEQRFQTVQHIFLRKQQNNKKTSDRIIPLFIFDEIGLAENSPDNPLKAIHEPLELSANSYKKGHNKGRQMAFVGISNTELDNSKTSRFLVLRRFDMEQDDMKKTAQDIWKGINKNSNNNVPGVETYLNFLSKTYLEFKQAWSQNSKESSTIIKNMFGLRDFYNLIKTFGAILMNPQNRKNSNFIEQACDLAIYRNFSGGKNSYEEFKRKFFSNMNKTFEAKQHNPLDQIISALQNKSQRFPMVFTDNISEQIFTQTVLDVFSKNSSLVTGSPYKQDLYQRQYIVGCLTNIAKIVSSDRRMIATSLNKTVQGSLFDLFNKFFTIRDGVQFYRYALESGKIKTQQVHPNFNAAVIVNEDNIGKASQAFLNRFQKYIFKTESIKIPQVIKVVEEIDKIIRCILRKCENQKMGHYTVDHLFYNYSEKTLCSLVYLAWLQNKKATEKQLMQICIKKLSKIASKDFQEIMNLVLLKDSSIECIEIFKSGIQEKPLTMDKSSFNVIITSDKHLWRKNRSQDVTIFLIEKRNEKSLEQEIKGHLTNPDKKDGTLFIDFSRETKVPGSNLNDPTTYFDSDDICEKVEIRYIVNLIKKCKQEIVDKLLKTIFIKKINIIVNYNRNQRKRFQDIAFSPDYQIYSLDGSSDVSKQEKIMDFNVHDIITNCLTNFFNIVDENEEEQGESYLPKAEFIEGLSNNEGPFAQTCKFAVVQFEGKNIQMTEQERLQQLRKPENLTKYNSIGQTLIKGYLENKFANPVSFSIDLFAKLNILVNFTDVAREHFLSGTICPFKQFSNKKRQSQQEKEMTKFLVEFAQDKIKKSKNSYIQMRQGKKFPKQQNKATIKINDVSFFPLSSFEIKIYFSEENKLRVKNYVEKKQNIEQYKNQHLTLLKESLPNQKIYDSYIKLTRNTDYYWSNMLMADIVKVICEKAKTSKKQIFYLIKEIDNLLNAKQRFFEQKIIHLIYNIDAWFSVIKILNSFAQNGITKNLIKGEFKFEQSVLLNNILRQSSERLKLTTSCINQINQSFNHQKMKSFIQIYHSVCEEFQNLIANKMIDFKDQKITELKINNQFLTLWESIVQIKQTDHAQMVKSLEGTNTIFKKMLHISNYLEGLLNKKQFEDCHKIILEYLANKLFPKWFSICGNENQIITVFQSFKNLCQKYVVFAHNSTSSIEISLKAIGIDYNYGKFIGNIGKISKMTIKNETDLRKKLFLKMSQSCKESEYKSILSVLIQNILYNSLEREHSLVQNKKRFTLGDLQKNFIAFEQCIKSILSGQSSSCTILSFAFIKLYLKFYIEVLNPENETCRKIDKTLCNNKEELVKNLRFYCLKLLRTKMTISEISLKYFKNKPLEWCRFLDKQMKEQESRSLEVPKIPESCKVNDLQTEIKKYQDSFGKQVTILDKIIDIGSQSSQGRYIVLNFFMKYIYTLSYEASYKDAIITHVKSKQEEYTQKMGAEQYKVILKYCESKIDDSFWVEKTQTFKEDDFIILNNFNWILATKQSVSPIHSLFFTDSKINQSISQEMKQSFIVCGPQNPYISIADVIYKDTYNNNIGVYICSSACDYMYSHLNCGWPSESKECIMCGEKIGSGGGHKIARTDQGARRIMSNKFTDSSAFYIANFLKLDEFWDAQRCYIKAEINRMRKKDQIVMKPLINKKRVEEVHNLKGYKMQVSNNRTNPMTSKVLILTIQSIVYCFVSLDFIKPEEYEKIFGLKGKKEVLDRLHSNIRNLMKEIKQVINLPNKFYSWMFGIQAQIFGIVIDFKKSYDSYLNSIKEHCKEVARKLDAKYQTLSKKQYKDLYQQLSRVIGNTDFMTKQFMEFQNQMTARNQFTRQVLEQKVEKIITKYYLDGKLDFVNKHYELQGKMQFPFEIYLNESSIDELNFKYSKMLKVPSQSLTFDQITTKYEIVISDRYPVLDYIMKNILVFKILKCYKEVISKCNLFASKVSDRVPRFYCKNVSVKEFLAEHELLDKVDLNQFFKSWVRISKDLGTVQVGCKIYGTMNDQLNEKSPVYNFLLDNILKENAAGKIITGIFSNYAKTQNELTGVLKNRKNLIPKYKKQNIFSNEYKKNPQHLVEEDYIIIEEEQIMNKLLEFSVPSVIYGENLVYHNFDYCENHFLMKVKRKFQLQQDTEKYEYINFAGETFSKGNPKGDMSAFSTVKEELFEQLPEIQMRDMEQRIKSMNLLTLFRFLGEMQSLVLLLSQKNLEKIKKQKITIEKFIKQKCTVCQFQTVTRELEDFSIKNIIPLLSMIEKQCRPHLIRHIPQKYRESIPAGTQKKIKQYVSSLPEGKIEYVTTKDSLFEAVENFVMRNLLSQAFEEKQKAFDYIGELEQCYPEQQALLDLTISQAPALLELLGQIRK